MANTEEVLQNLDFTFFFFFSLTSFLENQNTVQMDHIIIGFLEITKKKKTLKITTLS